MKLPAYKKRRALTLPEKDGYTRMLHSFRDKVMDMGFIIKAENDTYYIYLDDVLVYSLDKGTCKYNHYLYSQKMQPHMLRQVARGERKPPKGFEIKYVEESGEEVIG